MLISILLTVALIVGIAIFIKWADTSDGWNFEEEGDYWDGEKWVSGDGKE